MEDTRKIPSSETSSLVERVALRLDDTGRLLLSYRFFGNPTPRKYPLETLSPSRARLMGSGRALGESVVVDERKGAGLEHCGFLFRRLVHGKTDDSNFGPFLADNQGRLDAAHFRHRYVHHDHIRVQPPSLFHRLLAVTRLSDDFDIGMMAEELRQPLQHHGMVIDEQDADSPCSRGRPRRCLRGAV